MVVPQIKCNVYRNGNIRSNKRSVASLFLKYFFVFHEQCACAKI